jgi:hypothetical protein
LKIVHRHTFRDHTPELWDAVSTLRIVIGVVDEIARKIDPETSSENKYPGTDPEGAEALEGFTNALEDVAYELSKMTGENYLARLERSYDVDESDGLAVPLLTRKAFDLLNDVEVPERVKVYLKEIIEDSGWGIGESEDEETNETKERKGATVIEFPHD